MVLNQKNFLVMWSLLMIVVSYLLFFDADSFSGKGTKLAVLKAKKPVMVRSVNQLNFSKRDSGTGLYESDIVSTGAKSSAKIILETEEVWY